MSSYELDDAITTCGQLAAEATDPSSLNEILTALQSARQTIDDLEYDLDEANSQSSAKDDTISSLEDDVRRLENEVDDLEDEVSELERERNED